MSILSSSNLIQRVKQLSTAQRQLLTKRLKNREATSSAGSRARLVAYVVIDDHHEDSSEIGAEIRQYLETKLSPHMVPSQYVCLDSLPRMPNGKIDRNALPSPADATHIARPPHSEFCEPQSATENTLAAIWAEVLGCGIVGTDDDFFEIGGDSLLAIQIVSRVHEAGFPLTPDELFELRTIAKIARTIDASAASEHLDDPSSQVDADNTATADKPKLVQMIPIQPNGTRPAIYFIHTLGEGFQYCRSIAPYLGPDQPVFGITTMIDGMELDGGDITPYAEELRRHQPHGPYFLAGIFCGGREAFKLARLLKEQGEEIAWLGMIQAITDRSVFKRLRWTERVVAHWSNLRRSGLSYLRDRVERRRKKNAMSLEVLVAHQNYRFKTDPFGGRMILFRLANVAPFVKPELGWKDLAHGGIEIRDVPGNWTEMFEQPYVVELGNEVRDSVDEVIDRTSQE